MALCLATVLLVGVVFLADNAPPSQFTDFSVTYIGSRMVHVGLGPKLYDLMEQRKVKQSLLLGGEYLIYEHPPFEAFLLSPLGALSYKSAYLAWGLMNAAIWLGLLLLLRPYVPVPREELGYFALWLLFAPLGICLFVGQSSILMLLLYTLALLALRRRWGFAAGIALGMALLKFQFTIPLVLIFLLRKKWSVICGFATTGGALTILSLFAVGWHGVWSYIRLLTAITTHPDDLGYGAAIDMATIQGFIHAVFGKLLSKPMCLALVAICSGVLILWTARRWNRVDEVHDERGSDLMFGAAVVVSLLCGFHMFTHDLSPMILPLFFVAVNVSHATNTTWRAVMLGCLSLFWFPPVYFLLLHWRCMFLLCPVLLIFLFGCAKVAAHLTADEVSAQKSPGLQPLVETAI